MILGILLRDYKIYDGVNFIPISDALNKKFSVYVGDNGAGKSSILDSLRAFFNGGRWNINKNSQNDNCFVAPIFLIKKDKLITVTNDSKSKQLLEDISNYFWNVDEKTFPTLKSHSHFQSFLNLQNRLKKKYSPTDYYFLLIGTKDRNQFKTFFSSTFDKNIREFLINEKDYTEKEIDSLPLTTIRSNYSYVYIPVENQVNDILKLETPEMQDLMNKDILDKIDNTLIEKKFSIDGSRWPNSIIDLINKSLDNFLEDVNKEITKIDPSYTYKHGGAKRNITATDIRTRILEAFFAIRSLKKDGKEIYDLSSGEQRIALIDIAYAFLAQEGERPKNIILAIDEPEASMHMSKCFDQFQRIEKLSNFFGNQILITTHWYGFLPAVQSGNLHHLQSNEKTSISSFDFSSYLEDRKAFPDDIALKSFFELVTSIISSMKNQNTNWLICEGSDDKKYLSFYLKSKVENLKILPVGGIGNVVKLYKYLFFPVTEKSEKKFINSRVLCLIDTDLQQVDLGEIPSVDINKNIGIKRFQIENEKITLRNLQQNGSYSRTVMEDCLVPKILFDACINVATQYHDRSIEKSILDFSFNENVVTSNISGENSIFKPRTLEAFENKGEIAKFFNNNEVKYRLADEYLKLAENELNGFKTLSWVEEIIEFFKK